MPKVIFMQEEDDSIPSYEWLESLPRQARALGHVRIEALELQGHRLRRPYCDFLRDGIYELRWKVHSVQYRLLYFFFENRAIIVTNGTTKKDKVPEKEIELAIQRKRNFESKNS